MRQTISTGHQQLDLWSIPVLEVPAPVPPVPAEADQDQDQDQPEALTIHQLAKAVRGATVTTIRHLHHLGLMPNTALVGNRRLYGPADVDRLKLIMKLRRKKLKPDQIRQRLNG